MNNPGRLAVICRAPCHVQLLAVSSVDEPGSWTELVDGLRNPSDTSEYLISSKYSTSRLSPSHHRGVQINARNPRVWCKVKEECF